MHIGSSRTDKRSRHLDVLTSVAILISTCLPRPPSAHGQGIAETPNDSLLKATCIVIGRTPLNPTQALDTLGSGTIDSIEVNHAAAKKAFPYIPDSVLSNQFVPVLITAKHNLYRDPQTMRDLHTELYVKFNKSGTNVAPSYVYIPLVPSEPHNFWTSERGYDLAVVPIPAPLLAGSDITRVSLSHRQQL